MSQNYIPTKWEDNKTVGTASTMNNMEKGIKGAHDRIDDAYSQISAIETRIDNIGGGLDTLPNITGGSDMPRVFFYGNALPTSKTDVNLTMDYVSNTTKFSSYIKLKCQGTSSMSYAKKNFTINMYSDEGRSIKLKKDFKGWGAQSKFCLKANYVDTTHTRNISGARIAYDMVASRPDSAFKQQLLTAPRYGLVDGFPIKLYFNGEFYGIYTWNIPKDAWMFNMDESNPNHCVLCAERNTDGNSSLINSCQFRQPWNGSGDWSVEVGTASANIKASFDRCIRFVMNATDDEFKANIGEYFDLYSLLDYYCFSYLTCHLDGLAKNMLMATYDGVIWGASLYDMDSIYGVNWTGGAYVATNYQCPEQYQEQFSLLWERIEANFGAELYARYLELRQGALSLSNIVKHVEEIYDVIPDRVFADEKAKWTSLPNVSNNTMTRFRNYMRDRAKYVDAEMLAIGTKVPCTGIVLSNDTLSFTTTDTQTLSVVVSPTNTTDTITWSVSPTGIVTVNNGVVTPVANGECTITATCGSQSATCAVTVSGIGESGGDTPEVPEENLLCYYDSADLTTSSTTWTDKTGNGRDLEIVNNSGASLDITEQGLLLSSVGCRGTELNIPLTGNYTVEYELTRASNVANVASYAFNSTLNNSCAYCDSISTDTYRVNGYNSDITTDLKLTQYQMYKIRVIYGDSITLYANDVLVGTYTRNTFTANGNYQLLLGTSGSAGSSYFNGRIKSFKLYDGIVEPSGGNTPSEPTGDYVTDSLFAYYDLTQLSTSASTVQDLSGNNNMFTIVSGTVTKDDLGGLIYDSSNLMNINSSTFNPQSAVASIEYTFKYTGNNNCPQYQSYANKTCGINGINGAGYYHWLGGYGYTIFKGGTNIASDISLPTTLVNGEYYHVVITYSESEVKMYLNSELLGTYSHTVTGIPTSSTYFLGSTNHNANSTSQVLYSTRFYTKVLTQDEITQNYTDEFRKLGLISDVTYTDIKYIEGTGTQYINTGIVPTLSTKIELVADMSYGKQYDHFFGTDNFMKVQWKSNNSIDVVKKNGTGALNFTPGKHTIVMDMSDTANSETIVIDGTAYVRNVGGATSTNYPLLLLSGYSTGGEVETGYCGIGKIYSCKIYYEDTLVANMKPVLSSDGVYGLLDTVNNVFYDSEVGSFTGGGDSSSGGSNGNTNTNSLVLNMQHSSSHNCIPNFPGETCEWKYKPRMGHGMTIPNSYQDGQPWKAFGQWVTVYKENGKSLVENVGVELTDFKMWRYNENTNQWVLINDTFDYGSFYLEDFWDDGNAPLNSNKILSSDKRTYKCLMNSATNGRCFHPFSAQKNWSDFGFSGSPSYVVSQVKFRLIKWDESGVDNRANANLCVNAGGDYWIYKGASFDSQWRHNGDFAIGNFIKATNDWQYAYATSCPQGWDKGFPVDTI